MKLVTVVSNENHIVFRSMLKPSAEKAGLELIVARTDSYSNHRAKDRALLSLISKFDRQEVIFFTDGYDTLIVGDSTEIDRKYRSKRHNVVFSAEMMCWPASEMSSRFPATTSPFRFLNSGGFIGEAGIICDLIKESLTTDQTRKFSWSNQAYWQEQFLAKPDLIAVDSDCDLFGVLALPEDLELANDLRKIDTNTTDVRQKRQALFDRNFSFKKGRLHVLATNSCPCHIHFNGPLSPLLREIVREGIRNQEL